MTIHVVVMGPPGGGKSTLMRALLSDDPGLTSFGVRRYFTDQIARATPLGRLAKPYAERDAWLPDELVADAVRTEFDRGSFAGGVVFEGMPARRSQAELLDELLAARGLALDLAIHMDTPDEVCLDRAAARRVCYSCDHGSEQAVAVLGEPDTCARCGGRIVRRPNDTAELMSARLRLHRRQAPELLDFYRGTRLFEVDGRAPAETIHRAVSATVYSGKPAGRGRAV